MQNVLNETISIMKHSTRIVGITLLYLLLSFSSVFGKTTDFNCGVPHTRPLIFQHSLNAQISSQEGTLDSDLNKLNGWKAGEIICTESILQFGIDNCFQESLIDEKLFHRIYNKSYKADCTVAINDLRYLKVLHYDAHKQIHIGELICHKDISNDLLLIFKELFKASYPIERMVLIDNYNAEDEPSMQANNTTCFNFRKVAGTNTLSNHSTGHAIDINPLYNPYIKRRNGKIIFQPKTAKKYLNRSIDFPYKINKGDLCYQLFKKHGFTWGGEWKSVKDFQHFEKGN